MKKRGLSTIVVTLILIVLSLVAVGAVWLVVSNLLKNQSEQTGTDKLTFNANIEQVTLNESANNASITVERKVGAGNMKGMKFYFYNETNTEVKTEYFTLSELAAKQFSFNLNMPINNVTKISIVPIFNSKDGKDNIGNVADTYDVQHGTHIEVPQNETCTPKNCSDLGHNCDPWPDGCGAVINCGACENCVNGQCQACIPTTCSALGYTCGNATNGTCSGTLNCGTCNSTQKCLLGYCVSNVTSCSPSNYTYSCSVNKSIRLDDCGATQNVTCNATQICLTNSTRCMTNVTTCVPTTCAAHGYTCGSWANGTCGGTLNCGNCSSGQTCNATGKCVTYTPTANKKVGMNIMSIDYWDRELMFVDAMKYASVWYTTNDAGDWDTGQRNSVPADADGYALQLPYNNLYFATVTFLDTIYPEGDYVVLYDGDGDFEFGMGASVVSSSAGRIVIHVTASGNGIYMVIKRSNVNNHVRNIRIIMPGFESTYQTQVFYTSFLTGLQNFSTLRFMDAMKTNFNELTTWNNRTKLTTYTQTQEVGFAPEYIYLLGNRLNEDVWINIPAKADDTYVTNLAKMLNDNLNSNLKVYVEYSNEIWNFDAGGYYEAKGRALNIIGSADDFSYVMLYQAKRSAEIFKIFEDQFTDDSRLVKVIGTQAANYGVAEGVLGYLNDSRVNPNHVKSNALAIAPYFGGYTRGTVSQILNDATAGLAESITWMDANKEIASRYNLTLVAYEGGQGLVPSSESAISAVQQAENNAQMGQLYTQYLNAWVQHAGTGLNILYNYVTPCDIYGCWGALEYQNEPYSQSVKYTAIKNYLDTH
jgi:hypothetical protein